MLCKRGLGRDTKGNLTKIIPPRTKTNPNLYTNNAQNNAIFLSSTNFSSYLSVLLSFISIRYRFALLYIYDKVAVQRWL